MTKAVHGSDPGSAEPSAPIGVRPAAHDGSASGKGLRSAMLAVKAGFTLLGFILIARIVEPATLVERVRSTEPAYFAAAVLLSVAQIPLVGMRWRLIVRKMSEAEAFRVPSTAKFQEITYIAQFFGQVLPFLAGDGMRVLLLQEAGATLRIAFKSTLLDRAVAALVLFMLTLPALLFSPILRASGKLLLPVTLFILCGLLGAAVALALAGPLARMFARSRVLGAVTETLRDLRDLLISRTYAPPILGICVVVHGISMLVFWLLAQGQGLPFEASDAAAVVPLVLLVSMLPIAVGGWGVREGFVVALLGAAGVGPEGALLVSLSFGTVLFLAALPGSLILALATRASARARAPAEI